MFKATIKYNTDSLSLSLLLGAAFALLGLGLCRARLGGVGVLVLLSVRDVNLLHVAEQVERAAVGSPVVHVRPVRLDLLCR